MRVNKKKPWKFVEILFCFHRIFLFRISHVAPEDLLQFVEYDGRQNYSINEILAKNYVTFYIKAIFSCKWTARKCPPLLFTLLQIFIKIEQKPLNKLILARKCTMAWFIFHSAPYYTIFFTPDSANPPQGLKAGCILLPAPGVNFTKWENALGKYFFRVNILFVYILVYWTEKKNDTPVYYSRAFTMWICLRF